ncbi:MAG: flagellar basal-body MS-ring/collar protein FliF [Rhodoblastus sp.]
MAVLVEAQKLIRTIGNLGPQRLWRLGLIGVGVFLAVGLAGYLASRPSYETLYTGLDAQDLARVTGALRDANVPFDVSSDGATLLVEYGQASRARMILADRGLPRSGSAGYELFDKMGSLGLTSFMQEMTRVRALEGELARSIQSMQGVRAARVHIAPAEEGGFRRAKQAATASVVVRLSTSAEKNLAQAIRRLVAAATPGLTVEAVTVLSSDGTVLASGGEAETAAPLQAMSLEKSVSDALQDNIRQTLTPIVGARNFNVSVALRINTDKRQVNETIYNPESRVERSVRVIKENQTTQNSTGQTATSVERNIPGDKPKADGKVSNEENNKKEELTNYEISSKSVQTMGGSYAIERMSVAVLINKAALAGKAGDKDDAAFNKRMNEVIELASTAVGLSKERGDTIKVSAIDFIDGGGDLAPMGEPTFMAIAARQIGSILNALSVLAAAAIAGFVALRVLSRSASPPVSAHVQGAEPEVAELAGPRAEGEGASSPRELMELGANQRKRAQKRLEMLVETDDKQAAQVIKDWLRAEA